jgi:prepilin-type N-terminal cleavage/methylation domain-containing protein
MRQPHGKNHGFTLIEMSLVLVIIGLIIGGILVGQDMIKASEVRATLAQIEKYDTATNTFRTKYSALPGDILASQATQFGFTTAQGSGGAYSTQPNTLGNGLIESCQNDMSTIATLPPYGYVAFGCENSQFWVDLSQANLISEDLNQTGNAHGFIYIASTLSSSYVPTAKIAGNYILVFAWNGINYFYITGVGNSTYPQLSDSNGSTATSYNLTPSQAYQMDAKIDDGAPLTGKVLSNYTHDVGNIKITSVANSCINGSKYNLTGSASSTNSCELQIKASF